MQLVNYKRNQDILIETPPAGPLSSGADLAAARALAAKALQEKRTLLTEPEAKQLLSAFGIPVVETRVAADPEEAVIAAKKIGGPIAIKILSPDVTHKSDVGGVRLDIRSLAEVGHAAKEMLAAVRERAPDARIDGFTVQAMIKRPHDHELIVGIGEDAAFGPICSSATGGRRWR